MLVMSKGALSARQAETYYQEKYSQDDYYTGQHRVAGQWFGRGAEALGLADEVSPDDFRAVLQGQNPATAEALVQNAKGSDERRAGWDATFNAPKSLSIQALVGGIQGLLRRIAWRLATLLASLSATRCLASMAGTNG
jgi:conjugative relaxase-like TrwC/TraI family protein